MVKEMFVLSEVYRVKFMAASIAIFVIVFVKVNSGQTRICNCKNVVFLFLVISKIS